MHIVRSLRLERDGAIPRSIDENALTVDDLPLIVLGEPGVGKTELTRALATRLGAVRVEAGRFWRAHDLGALGVATGATLIIDGLDEVAASAGASAIDEILKRLSALGYPAFALSCRSADWQASSGKHRIAQDYGAAPVVAHIDDLTRQQSGQLLEHWAPGADADDIFERLNQRGLEDFYGNPLTLKLLAAVVQSGGGLPTRKAELFERASRLLVQEDNPGHGDSVVAQAPESELLDSAGAIFSVLLLSSNAGLSLRVAQNTPDAYIQISRLNGLPAAPRMREVLATRLFRGEGEGLFTPVHRVIAEYLAARWLARRLESGLSERRLFQALTVAGGVPTALRGVHAWLAYFDPNVAARCIAADPYGVLRYGDTERLTLPMARSWLQRLQSLVAEDPYFRQDDWGRHAASGLLREELRPELTRLLASGGHHFHLTTLLIDAMRGSPVAKAMAPSLVRLIGDETAVYVERARAAEILHTNGDLPDVRKIIRRLRTADTEDGRRLALTLVELAGGIGLSDREIAETYLQFEGLIGPSAKPTDEDSHHNMVGMGGTLAGALPPERAAGVLDALARAATPLFRAAHWEIRFGVADTARHLLERVVADGSPITPRRFWTWVRLLGDGRDFGQDPSPQVQAFVSADLNWRRAVQWTGMNDPHLGDAPLMALAEFLPRANLGLEVSDADAADHLRRLARRPRLSELDVETWEALMRWSFRRDGSSPEVAAAAQASARKHPRLEPRWTLFNTPPERDYRKEATARQHQHQAEVIARHQESRATFAPQIEAMRTGEARGPLVHAARVYLRETRDLPRGLPPMERLEAWLGPQLTEAALAGFMATLNASDLPTAPAIVELELKDRYWVVEDVMKAGIAERLRRNLGLGPVPRAVLEATLVSWWKFSEGNAHTLKRDVGRDLETHLFTRPEDAEPLLRAVLEPQLAADRASIPLLYRLEQKEVFGSLAPRLAADFLRAYPQLRQETQDRLLKQVLMTNPGAEARALIRERLDAALDPAILRIWAASALVLDLADTRPQIMEVIASDPEFMSTLRTFAEVHTRIAPLSDGQLGFIIEQLAPRWARVEAGDAGWGASNGWNATNFLDGCINALASRPGASATRVLDHLAGPKISAYEPNIAHARAQQTRLRRDTEFAPLAPDGVAQMLAGGLPTSIDDLKAYVLDQLTAFQARVLESETDDWKMFWEAGAPVSEEACRDRLLALMRGHFPAAIQLLPESLMPRRKRADAVALMSDLGVPIEIKGQWHREVWSASSLQLDALYARSWRAQGRGIYLVLWFGAVEKRGLPKRPDNKPRPDRPEQLQALLREQFSADQRDRLDVFVLNLDGRR